MLMEPNGIGGGMFSSISSGLLGVDNPLQPQQQQQQNVSNSQNPHPMHHSQTVSYASSHHEADIPQAPTQQPIKHGYPYPAKINQQMNLSDDDEGGFGAEDNVSSGDKRKASQWHRMKWTDNMVRLLIMAVYYIGDNDGGPEGSDKKKPAGLLQKKGKWKSVSKAMMEKGFFVSPQQCEDKFNDLNKRYKRVNDILGKGTACLVVENHSLLETMDLSPKRKEEVKKLLNSKHLFFREMCAYHNSCGHGAAGAGGHPQQQSPEVGTEPSQAAQAQQQQHHHQRCSHSSEVGMVNLGKTESEGLKMSKEVSREEDEDFDEDDESDDNSDEEEEESGEGVSRGHKTGNGHEDDDDNYEGRASRKRSRKEEMCCSSSKLMQEMSNEMMGVLQDGGRSAWEKRQWMKRKVMQLEEQKLRYEVEAYELEKQRMKWARFSSKKERDMERAKIENQRRVLENERMVLLLRQKDLELLSQSSPSPTPIATATAATFF